MAKDPAFLFYSSDFLSGVADLTMEERGQFITLLCVQHQKGRLTPKMIQIAVGSALPDVLKKFKQDESGFYYNERAELEFEKRKSFCNSRSKNRSKPKDEAEKKPNDISYVLTHEKHINNHMDKHMENENRNGNRDINELEISKTKEFIYYSIGKNISDESVLKFWKAFLIHSDDKSYLKDSEKISHFRNWLKTQDFAEKPNTVPVENKPKTLKERYLSPLLREGITLNEWEAEYDRLRPNLEAVDLTYINQAYIRGEPKWKKAVLQEFFKR